MPLPPHTHPIQRDVCLTYVPESARVSVGLWWEVPPALDPLAGVCVVSQAAVTYGQVDLQQHCLDFIEGCTAVRWQVMGEHGVGYPRVQVARGIAGGKGTGPLRTGCLEAGRGANGIWREKAG